MSDNQTCPAPPAIGKWTWTPGPLEGWRLVTPTGQHAATVYSTLTWFTWGPDGEGGQNASGEDIEDAKWQALHAAKVWWYEEGWLDPLAPMMPRQGSRVRLKKHDNPENVAVVVEVYPDKGRALLTSVPDADRFPKWKHAYTGEYDFEDMILLSPNDLPDPEAEEPVA
jgi:hypothetical protein